MKPLAINVHSHYSNVFTLSASSLFTLCAIPYFPHLLMEGASQGGFHKLSVSKHLLLKITSCHINALANTPRMEQSVSAAHTHALNPVIIVLKAARLLSRDTTK